MLSFAAIFGTPSQVAARKLACDITRPARQQIPALREITPAEIGVGQIALSRASWHCYWFAA